MFDELIGKGLPKWPQLMIVGDPVSHEQAKDIIFRTDSALYDPKYHGNDKQFEKRFYDTSGLTKLTEHCTSQDGDINFIKWYDILDKVEEELQYIELNYVRSSYAYSAYIGGPVGFCSPSGRIFFQENVGKWPSVEEVYQDFVNIAKAFPYLKFKATLYDNEACEDYKSPVVSFVINDGYVIITNQDFDLLNWDNHPPIDDDKAFSRLLRNGELGLPRDWYIEQAQRIRSIIDREIG